MTVNLGPAIGSGTYGEIYSASIGDKRNMEVAIKRLFVRSESNFCFSYREADICLKLNRHPNICGAMSVRYSGDGILWPGKPEKGLRDDDISIIMSLGKGNLCDLRDKEQLSEVRIKHITTQILLGLAFMHDSGYIHRDIKPTNIIYFDGDLFKIADFGISKRYFPHDEHYHMVTTDYFRPPEVLRLTPIYGYGVDIWSLGCTVHYMHCGDLPTAEHEGPGPYTRVLQVQGIIDCLPYDVSPDTLTDDPIGRHLTYECKRTPAEFFSVYREDVRDVDQLGEFLLNGMLMFDQRLRLTARELLDHPYLSDKSRKLVSRVTRVTPSVESPVTRLMVMREHSKNMMLDTYVRHSRLPWYKDKVLFSAITMYDRALSVIVEANPDVVITEMESQTQFRTCLYISAKYYSVTLDCNLLYEDFPFKEVAYSTRERAGEMERYIAEEVLRGHVYYMSIYDSALNHRRPTPSETASLLEFVVTGAHNGLTSDEAYVVWQDRRLLEG